MRLLCNGSSEGGDEVLVIEELNLIIVSDGCDYGSWIQVYTGTSAQIAHLMIVGESHPELIYSYELIEWIRGNCTRVTFTHGVPVETYIPARYPPDH